MTNGLHTTVTLPAGFHSLVVATRLVRPYFGTNEPLHRFQFEVRSADGSTTLATLDSFSSVHSWTRRFYDLRAFVGQTVRLWFGSAAAADRAATALFLDDASLYACGEAVYRQHRVYLSLIWEGGTGVLIPAPLQLRGAPLRATSSYEDFL